MNPRKVTIIDVAREAGVSIASVSRFLNNPSILRKSSRERIQEAVKKLNYRPLIHAQRLAGGKLDTFGLIIPGYEGIFYSFYALEIIRGVSLALERKNIDLHINIFWDKDNFKASLVDGVIFADVINNRNQLLRLLRQKIPTVVINRKVEDLDVSFVAVDNFKGGYEATNFLAKHGHRKIAHLCGDLSVQCAKERLDGYREALKNNNIPIKEQYIKAAGFSRVLAREALKEMFSSSNTPTAIFAASDEMAQEVLGFAREKGIDVPQDLSVIGFDDNPHCVHDGFSLTTVRQPLGKMAYTAVDILKDLVDEKNTSIRKIILAPEIIIRDTVNLA